MRDVPACILLLERALWEVAPAMNACLFFFCFPFGGDCILHYARGSHVCEVRELVSKVVVCLLYTVNLCWRPTVCCAVCGC